MNDKLTLDQALNAYRSIIKSRLPQPCSRDANAYDYRTGSMGRESSEPAYRGAIFYVKLSPKIDPEVLRGFLKKTEYYMVDGRNSRGRFHMLFLNDENGKFIHPKGPCIGRSNALRAARDYFDRYLDSTQGFEKKLTQVFPQIDLYSREKYPSKYDLCVLVTDEDGVEFDEDAARRIIRNSNKFVHIKALPENLFQIHKLQESDLESTQTV